jgi:hypothetical protein
MKPINHAIRESAIGLLVLCSIAALISSCSTIRQIQSSIVPTSDFFRVDNLPSGDQIASGVGESLTSKLLTKALVGSSKPIEKTYEARYDDVWNAARRAAMRLDAASRKQPTSGVTLKYRAITVLDKNNGQIQIGEIPQLGEMESLSGLGITKEGYMWRDEFKLKLEQLSRTQTKLSVLRRVVVGEHSKDPLRPSFGDKLVEKTSSCNYERWLLTQIEDDLTGKLKRESIAVVQLNPPEPPNATFVYVPRKRTTTAGLTLGLLKYSFNAEGAEQLKNLSDQTSVLIRQLVFSYGDSLQSALDHIVRAQGYRITGYPENLEQMTYPQKQSTPLVLTRRVNLTVRETYEKSSITQGQIKKGEVQDSLLPGNVNGKLSVSGRIILELYEPFSKERMWNKSINIPAGEAEFAYKLQFPGEEYFGGELDLKDFVFGEDTRPKVLGQILLSGYTRILDEALDSLSPTELKEIFELSNELRAKRKY